VTGEILTVSAAVVIWGYLIVSYIIHGADLDGPTETAEHGSPSQTDNPEVDRKWIELNETATATYRRAHDAETARRRSSR
jgi:hypothetical protein